MPEDISEYPQTYSGYDENNNVIITRTAKNATDFIDLAGIKTEIENVKNTVNQGLKRIAFAIANLSAGDTVLAVADKTIEPMISELAEQIGGEDYATIANFCKDYDNIGTACESYTSTERIAPIAAQVETALEEIYTEACKKHDEIQKQLNDEAYASCYIARVVNVK